MGSSIDPDSRTLKKGSEEEPWTDEEITELYDEISSQIDAGEVTRSKAKVWNFNFLGYDVLIRVR